MMELDGGDEQMDKPRHDLWATILAVLLIWMVSLVMLGFMCHLTWKFLMIGWIML